MTDEYDFRAARFSPHATIELQRRQIPTAVLVAALAQPEQILRVRQSRVVLHYRYEDDGHSTKHLLRVFVDVHTDPPVVVTVYRTSKIEKYWSPH